MATEELEKKEKTATSDVERGPTPAIEDAPDPDEDDLDDLDDMLDEFTPAKIDNAAQKPQIPEVEKGLDEARPQKPDNSTTDFNKELQEQMAALMGTIDESPEMCQEIEAMVREIGTTAEAIPPSGLDQANDAGKPRVSSSEAPFQETIRKTLERMEASTEQAAAAAAADESDDILAQMLKQMQSGGANGTDGEEDLSKMLMGMMEQLTNKDILFEPMKELHDKFPSWMEKNRNITGPADLKRYEEQQRLVGEITGRFERPGYSDSNAADREFIVERMQKMQAAGSPPADLVGDMSAAQEALGDLDSGCTQQ